MVREILKDDIVNPISQEILQEILAKVRHQIPQLWDSVTFVFDADQLQFLDYSSAACCNKEHLELVSKINEAYGFSALNVACQTLESATGFYWNWPRTESEMFTFKNGSRAIKMALQRSSDLLSEQFKSSGRILPYWGHGMYRDAVNSIAPTDVNWSAPGFTLSKERSISAKCHSYPHAHVITMGICVKPILDFINATIMSYWETRFISGPKRSQRLWIELFPAVLYLMNKIENLSHATPTAPVLLSEYSLLSSRSMTASQIQFVLMHELGHFQLDHIRKRNSGDPKFANQFDMEFEADAFAARGVISEVSNPVSTKYIIGSIAKSGRSEDTYPQGVSRGAAIHCLFLFLNFFEEAKRIVYRKILGERSASKSSTHPSSRDRLNNLKSIIGSEKNFSTPLVEYWRIQLIDATRYAHGQSGDDLKKLLEFIRLSEDHLASDDLEKEIAMQSINSVQSASEY